MHRDFLVACSACRWREKPQETGEITLQRICGHFILNRSTRETRRLAFLAGGYSMGDVGVRGGHSRMKPQKSAPAISHPTLRSPHRRPEKLRALIYLGSIITRGSIK